MEAELFRVDGRTDLRTDMTKLIVAFRDFANAPKNVCKAQFEISSGKDQFGDLGLR